MNDSQQLPGGLVLPEDPDALRALWALLPFPVSVREVITDDAGNPHDYRVLQYNQAYADFIQNVVRGTLEGKTLRECHPSCDRRMIERTGAAALGDGPATVGGDAFAYRGNVYRSYYCRVRHGVAACLFVPEADPDASGLGDRMEDRKYRAVVERASDIFLLVTPDLVVTGLNEKLLDELRQLHNARLDKQSLIGKHVSELFPDGMQMPAELKAVVDTIGALRDHNEPFSVMECMLRHPENGHERSFEVHAYRIHGGVAVMARETTAKAVAERNLRQADKMRSLGLMAGGIAHDFNNMLTGIKTFGQLLERQMEEGSRQMDCVRNILGSAERAADLTRQLLSFSRQGEFNRQPDDMHRVLGDVISLLKHGAGVSIRIHTKLHAECPVVPVNRTQIQSALLNIALNAVDSLENDGEITFRTADRHIRPGQYPVPDPQETEPGRYLEISITDTGCGMSETVRERLFEPFFTTKKGEKGTGMGLATAFGTVRAHNGRIDVVSAPGRGTTVTVLLPVPEKTECGEHGAVDTEALLNGARILVVDDEQDVRLSLQETLAGYRCRLTICTCGDEAVAAVRAEPEGFDALLLDMVMPGKDGLETLRDIRALAPDLRAVVLSGYADAGRKQQTIAEGVSAFVNKPFDIDVLVSALRQALL